MTLQDFIQLLNDRHSRGTLSDYNGHVYNDVIELYAENSRGLKEEFFTAIEDNLDRDNFSMFNKYLRLLTVSSFEEADNELFQTMTIKAIEKLELIGPSDNFY